MRENNQNGRRTFFNESLIENPTKEYAYFLGFFWADGHVSKDRIRLTLELVSEDVYSIKNIIDTLGIININDRKKDGRKDGIKRKPQSSFYFSNRKLYDLMCSLDYTEKSYKSFEKVFNYLPIEFHKYFIRGFFDGDGCIYLIKGRKTAQLNMSSSYEQDWNFALHYFKNLNINFNMKRFINKTGNKHSFIRLTKTSEIELFFKTIYLDNDGIYLKRKYDKFKTFMQIN